MKNLVIVFMLASLAATAQTNKLSKDEYLKRYQEAVRQAQINAVITRERQAVEKTAIKLHGGVFQVTKEGMLFNAFGRTADAQELVFVTDFPNTGLFDGQYLERFNAYPIGTYRYATAANGSRTVPKFTASLDKAVEWNRKQNSDQARNR